MRIEGWLKENYGYDNGVHEEWMKRVQYWREWYAGYAKDFHNYTIFNGKEPVPMRRKSLQMAKKVCEDWSNILFNINCTVTVENEASNENLQKILAKNSFWALMNQTIETYFAVGTAGIVLSVNEFAFDPETSTATITENTRPVLEMVDVEKIYPLSWDGRKCTECAFVTTKTVKGEKYAIVSLHLLENGSYTIKNKSFKLNGSGEIDMNSEESAIESSFEEFHTGSEIPWFVLFSPAVANNVMSPTDAAYDYPFGISVYANAIDALKCCDSAYDAVFNEITIGRMRIFASESMMQTVDGRMVFDAADIAVYRLPAGLSKEQLLQPVAPALRVDAMQSALVADLSVLSQAVGMGRQMYDFNIANMATAAQVYSVNSELKRSRDKHKTALEDGLYDILHALCDAATRFTGMPVDAEGLKITFDDAIFEDKTSESDRARLDFDAGLLSGWEYRMQVFGEDEQTAKARIDEIKQERMRDVMALQVVQGGEV